MNELSNRLSQAVRYLRENGYVKSDSQLAKSLGVTPGFLCMAMKGERVPSWGFLLDLCDKYPINFWWFRNGAGGMLKGETELLLLARIKELENRLDRLLSGQGA